MQLTLLLVIVTTAAALSIGEKEPRYACPETNVDFDGNDFTELHNVGSWKDCGIICNLSTDCKFWSWNANPGYQGCYLKTSDHGLKFVEGIISGQQGCM